MKEKWEIAILRAGEDYFPIKFEDWQNKGWELAGNVVVTVSNGGKYLDVPMKRLIKL